MMIGKWTGSDDDGDKWCGGLAGTAQWLELTSVDIEKAIA